MLEERRPALSPPGMERKNKKKKEEREAAHEPASTQHLADDVASLALLHCSILRLRWDRW